MPILNYTTKIPAKRTVGEIQGLLAEAGAQGVYIEYDAEKQPTTVSFLIELKGQPINFRLPCRWHGVHQTLLKEADRNAYKTEEHARRVAWRIVKDWVEAQLAIVAAELAELPEVFLPYAVNMHGRTVYQEFEARNLLLGDG